MAVSLFSHMKVLMVLKGDDDTQNPGVPANTNPASNQTVPHNPLLQAGQGEKGVERSITGWRRDTPAPMAIPKTTYLLSHNDSACQNSCQDTQPARNWLTPATSNQNACSQGLCLSPHQRALGNQAPQTHIISVSLLSISSSFSSTKLYWIE